MSSENPRDSGNPCLSETPSLCLTEHCSIVLQQNTIDTQATLDFVLDSHCGAEILFVGTTRRWTKSPEGQELETAFLMYEAYHAMALKQLEQMVAQAVEKWPIQKVAIVHRLGRVEPTEASVAIAVSTPHRREAFEAGQWLMDTLKHEVPIWKQEHYVQNGAEWIHPTSGSCRCDTSVTAPLDADEKSP